MNQSELTGTVDGFVALPENESNAPVLEKEEVPVSDIISALNKKKDTVVAQSAQQDTLKAALKSATQETVDAVAVLYDEFSSRIDAAAGWVGKKTPLGRQILKLSSDLLRASRSNGAAVAGGTEGASTTPLPKAA